MIWSKSKTDKLKKLLRWLTSISYIVNSRPRAKTNIQRYRRLQKYKRKYWKQTTYPTLKIALSVRKFQLDRRSQVKALRPRDFKKKKKNPSQSLCFRWNVVQLPLELHSLRSSSRSPRPSARVLKRRTDLGPGGAQRGRPLKEARLPDNLFAGSETPSTPFNRFCMTKHIFKPWTKYFLIITNVNQTGSLAQSGPRAVGIGSTLLSFFSWRPDYSSIKVRSIMSHLFGTRQVLMLTEPLIKLP